MSGVELALSIIGVVGVIDVALKYSKILIETCSSYNNAEDEIVERCVRLQSNYMQMRLQLGIIDSVRNHLDEQSQDIQRKVLEILQFKLGAANTKLNGFLNIQAFSSTTAATEVWREKLHMSMKKKSKYALLKDQLDKTVSEVESWQNLLFNPSWYVVMKTGSHQLDVELGRATLAESSNQPNEIISKTLAVRDPLSNTNSSRVFLPADKLDSAKIMKIAFSTIKMVQIENDTKWRLLDIVADLAQQEVRDLVVKLRRTTPSTFGLLTCLGAVPTGNNGDFNLVFRMPDITSGPETLRAKIMLEDSGHSLSDRFRLATQLARAVCSVHTFGMVHKGIRPENIVLFGDQESILGSAYLLGFEQVRLELGRTRLSSEDDDWEKDLYRHPQRQGSQILDPYIMQHDIYSLGVCLLEIGLWNSFVKYAKSNSDPARSHDYNFHADEHDEATRSQLVKNELILLAKTKLPERMGTKYSRIVETCLTCLDSGNEDFGDESEFKDEDGVLVAVRYIETILMQLSNISV